MRRMRHNRVGAPGNDRKIGTALLLLGLWGCGNSALDIKLTNIGDIPAHPEARIGALRSGGFPERASRAHKRVLRGEQIPKGTTTVYLRGTVIKQVPLLDAQLYQLDDASGKMWVFTTSSLPRLGDEITIAGDIRYESIPVEGLDFSEVYVWETQKLEQPDRGDATRYESQ
ncbi:MAG: hypothetical protein EBE86_023475 [Hormoscilla sp. GUM202]|nr:hypothetical protein [Hormoscilla sp. GUM202]